MDAILMQKLVWPNLKKDVEAAVKKCHQYQIGKKVGKTYGELPEKLAERPIAWNRVDVDLIGPWKIRYTRWKEISVSINNDRPLNRLV
jgi:hypothetical protein